MKALWHFVRRDVRDQVLIWALLAFVTLAPQLIAVFLPRFGFGSFYGYAYFLFLLVYCGQVWNFASGQALSREYLLSLPLPREWLFAIMWARCAVGAVPLLLYGVIAVNRLRSSFHVGGPWGLLGGLPARLQAVAFLFGVITLLFASLGASFNIQELWKTASRPRRILQIIVLILGLILDMGCILLWWLAFQPLFSAPVALLSLAAVAAYVAVKGWISYRRWLAGPEARLFARSPGNPSDFRH